MNTPHMNAALKDAPHMNALHQRSIVIDGLIIAKWDRSIFEDMRRGGLSAASCTVSVWEGFEDTVANIADMKALIRDCQDLASWCARPRISRGPSARARSASS